jgi:DNA invertase Pin-like site-specific DNA recombinase
MLTGRCLLVYNEVMTYYGYLRASFRKDTDPDEEYLFQKGVVRRVAAARNVRVSVWRKETRSTKDGIDYLPTLQRTLYDLREGYGDGIICSTQDRICRSIEDFNYLNDMAYADGWSLVFGDTDYDWTKARDRGTARIIAIVHQMEREMTSEKMKAWAAERKALGLKMGPTSTITPQTLALILTLRADGLGFRKIADALNERRVPTLEPITPNVPRAQEWYPKTINRILERVHVDEC